ncbi:hypothetical protein EJP77_10425 [Paenibacillus zeisoli]|uniref:Uncharacterized protein n=1 Tax=Paenibacillus zeisoli TaxID=2496267 RepID=A0A433XCH6_9BACL|nr:hypothetical protein [Paenibacillus zeisoli]RUT31793.1 hypothetical protein EJP77_10425 [Paenibacillus zeisoli]
MRKLLIILSTVMVFGGLFSGAVEAEGQVNSDKQINNKVPDILKSKVKAKYQMSDEAINDLTPEQLKNKIVDIDSVEVSKKEQYYRFSYDVTDPNHPKKINVAEVPKDEAYKQIEAQKNHNITTLTESCGISNGHDCVKEEWIQLETWVSRNAERTSGTVSSRFQWLTPPYYTDQDVFSIGLNSNFSPTPGTESATYKYSYGVGYEIGDTVENFSTPTVRGEGGYGYTIQLAHGGGDYYVFNHRGYMEYKYSKNVTNPTLVDAFSTYAHQQVDWDVEPSFSIPLGGSLALQHSNDFDKVYGHAQFKPW